MVATIIPAVIIPRDIDSKVFLKSSFNIDAIIEPVHTPVVGTGIALSLIHI